MQALTSLQSSIGDLDDTSSEHYALLRTLFSLVDSDGGGRTLTLTLALRLTLTMAPSMSTDIPQNKTKARLWYPFNTCDTQNMKPTSSNTREQPEKIVEL